MISHGRIKTCKAVQDEASFHQREQVTRDPLIAVLVTRDRVISSGIPRSELMGSPLTPPSTGLHREEHSSTPKTGTHLHVLPLLPVRQREESRYQDVFLYGRGGHFGKPTFVRNGQV